MPRLFLEAVGVLEDRDAAPGLVASSMACLCEAVRLRHDVPINTAATLWRHLRGCPCASWAPDAAEALGVIAPPWIIEEVVDAVRGPGSGDELVALGLDTLAGESVAMQVTDRLLAELVERRHLADAGLVRLIHAVAAIRTVDVRIVDHLVVRLRRGRWRSRALIADLLEFQRPIDSNLVEDLLVADPSPKVRLHVASRVADFMEGRAALATLGRALERENTLSVRLELAQARDELIRHLELKTAPLS